MQASRGEKLPAGIHTQDQEGQHGNAAWPPPEVVAALNSVKILIMRTGLSGVVGFPNLVDL